MVTPYKKLSDGEMTAKNPEIRSTEIDLLVPSMTDSNKAHYDELTAPQNVTDVISAIQKVDWNTDSSRDALTSYLGRNTIPSIPFGTQAGGGGQIIIGPCPAATQNSTNYLEPDKFKDQLANPVGLTLTKLTLTPATPTNLPARTLRVFFALGNLYLKSTTTTTTSAAAAALVDIGYFVAINPFDGSYWFLRDFNPIDDNGIEHPTTQLGELGGTKFSVARVKDGKALLGNGTAPLQLDTQMTFSFTKDEIKIGGVLTEEEYRKAKAEYASQAA